MQQLSAARASCTVLVRRVKAYIGQPQLNFLARCGHNAIIIRNVSNT